jgi:hypothetical protein
MNPTATAAPIERGAPITHRTARKIAERISQILGEEFPEERVYQWRDSGKIRCFSIGSSVAAREDTLLEDLTGRA